MSGMSNPYEAIWTAKSSAILAGAETGVLPAIGTLSERLRNFAYYMTEQQKTGADAMLVFDLHAAADKLEARR